MCRKKKRVLKKRFNRQLVMLERQAMVCAEKEVHEVNEKIKAALGVLGVAYPFYPNCKAD